MSFRGTSAAIPPSSLEEIQQHPGTAYEAFHAAEDHCFLDVAWQLLHFIITKKKDFDPSQPLSLSIYGSHMVAGHEDETLPLTYLTADEVKAAHGALQAVSEDALVAAIDTEAIVREDIYGFEKITSKEEIIEWVVPHLEMMKKFYAAAAEKGMRY